MKFAELRHEMIGLTVDSIRAIAGTGPVDRVMLEHMENCLISLARRRAFFAAEATRLAEGRQEETSLLHCDPDGRFALYLFAGTSANETPPHDHTTWAVIAGIVGEERNRLYRRLDDGSRAGHGQLEFVREVVVGPGSGLAMAEEDVHSIHIQPDQPILHLHMYGKRFEQQTGRVRFDVTTGETAAYGLTDV